MSDEDETGEVASPLRSQFRARLAVHAEAMRQAWRRLGDTPDPGARREAAEALLSHAHRLAGGAGIGGLPAISAAAAPVEDAVRAALAAGEPLTLPAVLAPLVARLLALCDGEDRLGPR
jgi:HPt (histidine-containing phosphotransfer) domain-containing protein